MLTTSSLADIRESIDFEVTRLEVKDQTALGKDTHKIVFVCSVPVKKVYPYHYWGQICFLTILGFFFTVNQIMHYDCPSTPSLSVSLSKFVEISKLMMSPLFIVFFRQLKHC